MNLKSFIIVALLVLGFQQSSAQVYHFQATGFSVLEKTPRGTWGQWSELQPTSLIITLDTNKNRIVVYSQEIQVYTINTYGEKEESDADLVYPFICSDSDGMPFTISIITRKLQGGRKQLYINQKDVVLVYNIINHIPSK